MYKRERVQFSPFLSKMCVLPDDSKKMKRNYMKVLIMIFALHFFLGAMLFIKMGSPDVRKGLRQASELMVKNSSFR